MQSRQQSGFTLIEVLVAVGILAVALGAIISSGSSYASNASYLRDKTMATWVAHNVLNQWHLTNQYPSPGERTGEQEMAGRDWAWVAKVQKTPDADVRRVDIEVRLEEQDEDERLITVSGFLTPPQ